MVPGGDDTFANLPVNDIQDGNLSWDDASVIEHVKTLLNCPWYEDEQGFLYIVTPDEIEGPDGPMLDTMNFMCRRNWPPDALDSFCNVVKIADCLKRFSRVDGFYHA